MSKVHEIRKSKSKVAEKSTAEKAADNRCDNLTPNGVPGVNEAATAGFNGAQPSAKADRAFEPLAIDYIGRAVESMTRAPSLKLKSSSPQFYADLLVRRDLVKEAIKLTENDLPKAFVNVVMATQVGGGSLDAIKVVRDLSRQLLWIFAMDVQRDRRVASERDDSNDFAEEAFGKYPGGEERPPLPTEDEARIAYAEAHAWLSNIADLIPIDEDERVFLNLDKGLEYAQVNRPVNGEANWVHLYDFEEALEHQLMANEESFKKRAERHVQANKAKFAALAALAA